MILLCLAAVAFGIWSVSDRLPSIEEPETADVEPALADAERPPTEKYPVPDSSDIANTSLVPLPDLADSDAYFKLELEGLFGRRLAQVLRDSGGIERIVTTIDNLPRQSFAERLRPVSGPTGVFRVAEIESRTFTMHEDNARRYDAYVAMLENANTDDLVSAYRRFYPLLQEAYVKLGYPNGFFNDRVIEVIDDLLATPVLDDSVTLTRPHVLYEFSDPKLEAASFGQKTLMRMGPEHTLLIKRRLQQLRERLISL